MFSAPAHSELAAWLSGAVAEVRPPELAEVVALEDEPVTGVDLREFAPAGTEERVVPFLLDHPRDLASEPYAAGLPTSFPAYCAIR